MKEKFNNLINLLKSIVSDFKSWEKIIYNNWHKHVIIGLILGVVCSTILNLTFAGVPFIAKIIICAVCTFIVCLGFEFVQQGSRIIDEKERFESNKDLLVGFIASLISIIINLIIIK